MRGYIVPAKFWLPMRFALGLMGPKNKVLGMEVSGVVESVGKSVEKFRIGDEVLVGTGFGGGYAEYICLPDDRFGGKSSYRGRKETCKFDF